MTIDRLPEFKMADCEQEVHYRRAFHASVENNNQNSEHLIFEHFVVRRKEGG